MTGVMLPASGCVCSVPSASGMWIVSTAAIAARSTRSIVSDTRPKRAICSIQRSSVTTIKRMTAIVPTRRMTRPVSP